jgi:hypothetical protein
MKAIALFQFYFTFVFPRDNDWQNQGSAFQFPDLLAQVRPMNLEEELFPRDIDKTLSTMQWRGFRRSELSEIRRLVEENVVLLEERWHEHFGH